MSFISGEICKFLCYNLFNHLGWVDIVSYNKFVRTFKKYDVKSLAIQVKNSLYIIIDCIKDRIENFDG